MVLQAGVQRTRLMQATWSRKWMIVAYVAIIFMTLVADLDQYSTSVYVPYATSSFSKHSMLTTLKVVEKIMGVVMYFVAAKWADIFGRVPGIAVAVFFSTIGNIMFAASRNISMYVASGVFSTIGDTSLDVLLRIFIADSTTLRNRAIATWLPNGISSIAAIYAGSEIGGQMLKHSTWRMGYAVWAIVLPFAALPFIAVTLTFERKAKKLVQRNHDQERANTPSEDTSSSNTTSREHADIKQYGSATTNPFSQYENDAKWMRVLKILYIDLDAIGCILLGFGLGMILVPISLAGKGSVSQWANAEWICLVVFGVVIVSLFAAWEYFFAPHPIFARKPKVIIPLAVACSMGFFEFLAYAVFTGFFPSFLQVAYYKSATVATRIDNSLRVAYVVSSPIIGLVMRYVRHTKPFVIFGVPLTIIGLGLQVLMCSREHKASEAQFIVAKVLVGVGRGIWTTAALVTIQGSGTLNEIATSTGIYYAFLSIGGSAGTAISGAIWNGKVMDRLRYYLPNQSEQTLKKIFGNIKVALKYPEGSAVRTGVANAYKDTQRLLAIVAVGTAAINLILMWFLPDIKLEDKHEADTDSVCSREPENGRTAEEKKASVSVTTKKSQE